MKTVAFLTVVSTLACPVTTWASYRCEEPGSVRVLAPQLACRPGLKVWSPPGRVPDATGTPRTMIYLDWTDPQVPDAPVLHVQLVRGDHIRHRERAPDGSIVPVNDGALRFEIDMCAWTTSLTAPVLLQKGSKLNLTQCVEPSDDGPIPEEFAQMSGEQAQQQQVLLLHLFEEFSHGHVQFRGRYQPEHDTMVSYATFQAGAAEGLLPGSGVSIAELEGLPQVGDTVMSEGRAVVVEPGMGYGRSADDPVWRLGPSNPSGGTGDDGSNPEPGPIQNQSGTGTVAQCTTCAVHVITAVRKWTWCPSGECTHAAVIGQIINGGWLIWQFVDCNHGACPANYGMYFACQWTAFNRSIYHIHNVACSTPYYASSFFGHNCNDDARTEVCSVKRNLHCNEISPGNVSMASCNNAVSHYSFEPWECAQL